MCKQYQGWSNYETWCYKLWIDNDQCLQEEVLYQARKMTVYNLSKYLEDLIEDHNPLQGHASMYGDLLMSAIENIDHYEIAESFIEEAREREEEEDQEEE